MEEEDGLTEIKRIADGRNLTEPEQEARQKEYIEKAARALSVIEQAHGRALKSSVVTFGCQMNARDSEKLRGILAAVGFEDTEDELDADFILYNTCTVRENADQHVYGRLGRLTGLKKKRPDLLVGMCGCMMQEEHVVRKIRRSYPVVDLIFGTHNLFTFPVLYRISIPASARGG